MNASTKNSDAVADSTPTAIPQITPPDIGRGHPEYHFVQAVSEINKNIGELSASVKAMDKTIESLKNKVDGLVTWKNMIVGGAITLGAVASLAGLLIVKFSDYVTLKSPSSQTIQEQPSIQSPQQNSQNRKGG